MEVNISNLSIMYNIKNLDESFLRKNLLKKIFLKKENKNGQFLALQNINFKLVKGDRLGIIGANGSGKSTLIKCLANILNPTEGSNKKVDGKFLPIIEPWALAEPTDSVLNNITLIGLLLGFKKKYIEDNVETILKFSELEKHKNFQFSSLSTGMKMRLIFAVVFLLKTEIFFIDEFLTTGDEKFREKGFNHLIKQSQDNIIVLCSHEREIIKIFCNKILVLNKGKQEFFGDINEGFKIYDQIILNNN